MSRLRQLLDALGAGAETDTDAQDPPADQSPAAGQEPGTPPAPEEQQLVPLLGQLRLLRSLQEELNFETAELSRDTTTPDETREVRAIALAARQQQIANIAAAILDQINQKQAK